MRVASKIAAASSGVRTRHLLIPLCVVSTAIAVAGSYGTAVRPPGVGSAVVYRAAEAGSQTTSQPTPLAMTSDPLQPEMATSAATHSPQPTLRRATCGSHAVRPSDVSIGAHQVCAVLRC